MSKPIIRIHNQETNEIIDREMTDEEFEMLQTEAAAAEAEAAKAAAKEVARQALLAKLGITEDEAKLLLS